jgi:hypothetical protein
MVLPSIAIVSGTAISPAPAAPRKLLIQLTKQSSNRAGSSARTTSLSVSWLAMPRANG